MIGVLGLGLRVEGLESRIRSLELRIWGLGVRSQVNMRPENGALGGARGCVGEGERLQPHPLSHSPPQPLAHTHASTLTSTGVRDHRPENGALGRTRGSVHPLHQTLETL